MLPGLSEYERSPDASAWWRDLPRARRLELLRSLLRDAARDRAIDAGRALSRELLRTSQREHRGQREDPRRWDERDYYEHWVERVPTLRCFWRFETHLFIRRQSAPNLLAVVADAWDGID